MRKPRKPTVKALAGIPDHERCRVLDLMRGELVRMFKRGSFHGDPNVEHPAVVLARLMYDPDSAPALVFACAKELLPYCEAPKASQMRIEANGGNGEVNITVVVQPWAAGKRADEADARPAVVTSAAHAIEDGRADRDSD